MIHPDQEVLAQYIDGDLSPALAVTVESHLAVCPTCRANAAAFDRQADLLREAVLELPGPRRGRVPRRSWAPAVAAALLLAFAVAFAASPTLAKAVVRIFPFGKVYELSPQEVKLELARLEAAEPKGSGGRCPMYRDREEAIAEWANPSQKVLGATYLPEGFRPWRYSPCVSAFSTVYMHIQGSTFDVTQWPLSKEKATWKMPEGAGEEVTVNGKPAMLIRGTWATTVSDRTARWEPGLLQLWFEHRGQSITITHLHGQSAASVNLTGEELIRVAESLR